MKVYCKNNMLKSNSRKVIFAIGGKKNSKLFADVVVENLSYEVVHIFDDPEDKECRLPEILKKEIEIYLKKNHLRPVAFIAFARNTVNNSVENIALLFDDLSANAKYKNAKFIGPSFASAEIFSNKWVATKQLQSDGFSCLQTVKVTANSVEEIKKKLKEKEFPLPSVLKATNLTGGTGLLLVNTPEDLELQYRAHLRQGITESILTEYLEGQEVSLEFLYLDNEFFVFPMSFKENTNLSLDHGDSKIKIAGYLKSIAPIYKEALKMGKKYNTKGYFAIEGIVYDCKKGKWKIMEGMTRFTGSYPMLNATCPPFDSLRAVFEYIEDKPWNKVTVKNQVVFQLPVFKESKEEAERMVVEINRLSWIITARVEDLFLLPLSLDKRIRIQITFKAEEKENFHEQLKQLSTILDDPNVPNRIYKAINKLNKNFPDLIIKKGIFDI